MTGEKIVHKGIVTGSDNEKVFISIIAESACSACHAKGFCNLSEATEKIIEVDNDHLTRYKTGDDVNVVMQRSAGMKAVILSYVVPFAILLATLIGVASLSGDEGLAGLAAILVLVPYYLLLYLFRDRLKSQFNFTIEK